MKIFQNDDGRYCLMILDSDLDEEAFDLFEERELQGGGYTFQGIVEWLIENRLPKDAAARLQDLGAEADNMYLYSEDRALLDQVADLFRATVTDLQQLADVLDQAGEDIE